MAGVLLGKLRREARIEVTGGVLEVAWREADGHVLLRGPAEPVYSGIAGDAWLSDAGGD